MDNLKNEEEILRASYRVELFIRKVEKQIQNALIYKPDPSIRKDIDVLNTFIKSQKQVIEQTRDTLLLYKHENYFNYLDTPIRSTPLSTRTINTLKSADVKVVRDLIDLKNKRGLDVLNKYRNFGKTSLVEVITFINAVESL